MEGTSHVVEFMTCIIDAFLRKESPSCDFFFFLTLKEIYASFVKDETYS